jgi:hypothetical protein
MTWATNNFEDQEGEVFPAEAHEAAIAWAEKSLDYPEISLWHTPGTEFGQVDWEDFDGHYRVSSGYVYSGKEDLARGIAADDSEGPSHGHFVSYKEGTKEVSWYRDFELTILPRSRSANQWFPRVVVGERGVPEAVSELEEAMAFSPARVLYLSGKGFSADEITALERQTAEMGAVVRAHGISFKDLGVEGESGAPTAPVAPEPMGSSGPALGSDATVTASSPAAPVAVAGVVPAPTGAGAGLSIDDVNRAVDERLAPVLAGIKELTVGMKALREDDDTKLSQAWSARLGPGSPGYSASGDGATVVAGAKGGADYGWLGELMARAENGAGAGGGGE